MTGKPRYNWDKLKAQFVKDHVASGGALKPKAFCAENDIPYSTGRRYITMDLISAACSPSVPAAAIVKKSDDTGAASAVGKASAEKEEKLKALAEAAKQEPPPPPRFVSGIYSEAFFTELQDYCADFYDIDDTAAEITGITIVCEALQRAVMQQLQALNDGKLEDAVTLRGIALSKTQLGKAVTENWSFDTLLDHYAEGMKMLIRAKETRLKMKKSALEVERLQALLGGNDNTGLIAEFLKALMGQTENKPREPLPGKFPYEQ